MRLLHNGNYGEQESIPMTVMLLQVTSLFSLLANVTFIISIVSYVDPTSRSASSPNRYGSPLPNPPHSPTLHSKYSKRTPFPRLESPRRILNLSRAGRENKCRRGRGRLERTEEKTR